MCGRVGGAKIERGRSIILRDAYVTRTVVLLVYGYIRAGGVLEIVLSIVKVVNEMGGNVEESCFNMCSFFR